MSKVSKKEMEKLAERMIDYFTKEEIFSDVNIYVNNKLFSSSNNSAEEKITANGSVYYLTENVNVKEYCKYCNPDTITITFEGPLYDLVNYMDEYDYVLKLDELFLKDYGMYFEQGYAWSMAAYF